MVDMVARVRDEAADDSAIGSPTQRAPTPQRTIVEAHVESLVSVLDLVRSGAATTRPEITALTGLGRNIVTERVAQLESIELVGEGVLGPSTGGRAPRRLEFRAEAGYVLVAALGATDLGVALCNLSGQQLLFANEVIDVVDGPHVVLARVAVLFDELLSRHVGRAVRAPARGAARARRGLRPEVAARVWGIGITVPGPVEFATGRPVAPPIMPGWDGFDIRGYFADQFPAPVWVDNDVNAMALGEFRAGAGQGHADQVFIKVGSGIGAGLISGSRLHHGAQGCAGDIGHTALLTDSEVVCRCGKTGCLEAYAGGIAIARDAELAAREGRSDRLAALLRQGHRINMDAVADAAAYGDQVSLDLITRSAHLVGESLARIVNFFNPSLILVGGRVAESGDLYLAELHQVVLRRSLPLATRSLRLIRSPLGAAAGVSGAAFTVIDELLSREGIQARLDRVPLPGQRHPAQSREQAARS